MSSSGPGMVRCPETEAPRQLWGNLFLTRVGTSLSSQSPPFLLLHQTVEMLAIFSSESFSNTFPHGGGRYPAVVGEVTFECVILFEGISVPTRWQWSHSWHRLCTLLRGGPQDKRLKDIKIQATALYTDVICLL